MAAPICAIFYNKLVAAPAVSTNKGNGGWFLTTDPLLLSPLQGFRTRAEEDPEVREDPEKEVDKGKYEV